MRTWLHLYAWMLANLLAARFAESYPGGPEPIVRRRLPVWAIVLIVLAVVLCLAPLCVWLILLLLGPQIGEVFSEIITDLEAAP